MLAALVAGLLLPAVASAMPMQADPMDTDETDCLSRTGPLENMSFHDAVDGNYWGRRDTYTLIGDSDCSFADIRGLSLIVKTPYQIDSTPDVDDIDTFADFSILRDEMEFLWPEFGGASPNLHWAASAGAGGPDEVLPPDGMFPSIKICINVASVAACIGGSPLALTDIGGGFMIFTIDLDAIEETIFLDSEEGDDSFDLVTLVHSDMSDPPIMVGGNPVVPIPEMVMGLRAVELVPEPALAALLLPALALALRRRRAVTA